MAHFESAPPHPAFGSSFLQSPHGQLAPTITVQTDQHDPSGHYYGGIQTEDFKSLPTAATSPLIQRLSFGLAARDAIIQRSPQILQFPKTPRLYTLLTTMREVLWALELAYSLLHSSTPPVSHRCSQRAFRLPPDVPRKGNVALSNRHMLPKEGKHDS